LDEECQILEDKKTAYNKMINRNHTQIQQEHKNKRKAAYKMFRQNKRILFESKAGANGIWL
jgi:hypothetical protein